MKKEIWRRTAGCSPASPQHQPRSPTERRQGWPSLPLPARLSRSFVLLKYQPPCWVCCFGKRSLQLWWSEAAVAVRRAVSQTGAEHSSFLFIFGTSHVCYFSHSKKMPHPPRWTLFPLSEALRILSLLLPQTTSLFDTSLFTAGQPQLLGSLLTLRLAQQCGKSLYFSSREPALALSFEWLHYWVSEAFGKVNPLPPSRCANWSYVRGEAGR